ncbi:MAG: alpha/beta hydrolase [Saprospirales bacterium]|nr:alpha/beta hydrolase [Saprospirales bacterium]
MQLRHSFRLLLFSILSLLLLPDCRVPMAALSQEKEAQLIEKDSRFEEIVAQRRIDLDLPTPKGFMTPEPGLDETLFSTVPVYYATDRKPSGKLDPYKFYSGKPDPEGLAFGKCIVTIPAIHELGELERPSWWTLEFSENTARHMVLKEVSPLSESDFFQELQLAGLTSNKHEALVFIHGFNVSFDEAALQAAQIAYDVSFGGIPVLYSWPSKGSVFKYGKDGKQNATTVPHLEYFLEALAQNGGFEKIHIVAHSMGNRALTESLMNLARKEPDQRLFDQVILAAPDVDSKAFVQDIAPLIYQTAQNVTLYASSKDKALLLSEKINKAPRAGEAGEHLVVVDHIETVDASDIDTDFLGHSYFSNTWLLIDDLHKLIDKGWVAERRELKTKERERWRYWLF